MRPSPRSEIGGGLPSPQPFHPQMAAGAWAHRASPHDSTAARRHGDVFQHDGQRCLGRHRCKRALRRLWSKPQGQLVVLKAGGHTLAALMWTLVCNTSIHTAPLPPFLTPPAAPPAQHARQLLGIRIGPTGIAALLDKVDKDGTGEIELGEFSEMMTEQLAQLAQGAESASAAGLLSLDVVVVGYRRAKLLQALQGAGGLAERPVGGAHTSWDSGVELYTSPGPGWPHHPPASHHRQRVLAGHGRRGGGGPGRREGQGGFAAARGTGPWGGGAHPTPGSPANFPASEAGSCCVGEGSGPEEPGAGAGDVRPGPLPAVVSWAGHAMDYVLLQHRCARMGRRRAALRRGLRDSEHGGKCAVCRARRGVYYVGVHALDARRWGWECDP